MNEVEVNIDNKIFKIKTSASNKEMSDISQALNKRLDRIRKETNIVSTDKLAILASLLTTADNYVLKKKIDLLIEKISEVCNWPGLHVTGNIIFEPTS